MAAISASSFSAETRTVNDANQTPNGNFAFVATLLGERFALDSNQNTSQVRQKQVSIAYPAVVAGSTY